MAAPERFAEKSDSSCTAGTVHTWPKADIPARPLFFPYRVKGDIEQAPSARDNREAQR